MRTIRRFVPALLTALITNLVAAQTLDPLAWLAALDKPQLDTAAALRVDGQVFRIGPAVLRLESGVLVPTMRVAGQIEEAVFIGSGRLQFEPPDPIERGQLELFALKSRLDEPFEQLVLGGAGLRLEDVFIPGATPAGNVPSTATDMLQAWKDGVVRGPRQIAESLVQARLDTAHAGAFCFAALEVKDLGRLLLEVDPDQESPFSLNHYTPLELNEWEKLQTRHLARRHQRAGRMQDFDLDRLATWDLWCSAKPDDDRAGGNPFVGKSYVMDVTIEPGGEKIHGTSLMRIAARNAGGRMLHIGIASDLKLSSLREESGSEIPFRQRGSSVWAFLPALLAPGSESTVKAEFAGTLFEKVKGKEFRTWQTLLWHPHVWLSGNDMTELELTVRWSPPLDVRVGGKRISQGMDDGQKSVKHVSPVPAFGIFLEVGQFEDVSETRGQRTITASFSKQNQRWMSKGARTHFVSEAHEALEWMEKQLGPYPYGDLSFVIVDQGYGQSLPGTIIYPDLALYLSSFALAAHVLDWRVMLAHEIAHQWWGNGVRPATERDNWLSEGMSEYLSQLYGRRHLLQDREEPYVPPTKNWSSSLDAPAAWGWPVERVGPLVLGSRLDSSRCPNCDDALVYVKGALALETLGQYVGEDQFLKMLREIVKRSMGTAVSGSAFVSMIGKMSNANLGWFTRRYLEGTGYPLITYTYRVEPGSTGGWDVTLTISQAPRIFYTSKIVKVDDGQLRVAKTLVPSRDVGTEPLPLPFALRVYNPQEPETKTDPRRRPTWRDRANWRLAGRVMLEGTTKTITLHSDFEVIEVLLDPDESVLAEVLCETCTPKSILLNAAVRAADSGQLEQADELLAKAQAAEVDGDPPLTDSGLKVRRRREAAAEDAMIHCARSNLALMRGDLDTATAEVDLGAKLVTEDMAEWAKQELDLQRARLYLRRGEDRKAYLLLWNLLSKLDCPSTESLMLMAIAAHRTDEAEAYNKAMRRAKLRRVDVSVLEALRPVPALDNKAEEAAKREKPLCAIDETIE